MTSALGRGLIAGAAGTTALNVVTYLDMAARGRPTSSAPGSAVDALAAAAGTALPGDRAARANRREGLGAVLGLTTGLAVGVAAGLARAAGVRLPAPLAAVATGAAAMAASDVPMAALGVNDPRSWTTTDWLADAIPHLAYGAVTHAALVGLEVPAQPPRRAAARLVVRSAVLGLAAGGRSTLGLAGPALAASAASGRARAALVAVAGEMVADKLPATPSRLVGPALPARVAAGAGGGVALARSAGSAVAVPALLGGLGALAGSYGGAAWRRWAGLRVPDWQAALLEDGVAIALAALACRPRRHIA